MPNDTSDEPPEAPGRPSMSRVLLLNDDVTPMDFVVHVLESIFDKDLDTARQLMLQIHHQGSGVAGSYPAEIADAKAKLVEELARKYNHPLSCAVER